MLGCGVTDITFLINSFQKKNKQKKKKKNSNNKMKNKCINQNKHQITRPSSSMIFLNAARNSFSLPFLANPWHVTNRKTLGSAPTAIRSTSFPGCCGFNDWNRVGNPSTAGNLFSEETLENRERLFLESNGEYDSTKESSASANADVDEEEREGLEMRRGVGFRAVLRERTRVLDRRR